MSAKMWCIWHYRESGKRLKQVFEDLLDDDLLGQEDERD